VALRALFVKKRKLDVKYVENINNAILLREDADYRTHFSKLGAKLVTEKAEKFLEKVQEILKKE
jgi:uncharacterized protein (UPF0332 family)